MHAANRRPSVQGPGCNSGDLRHQAGRALSPLRLRIDLDRVVWDPDYREWAKRQLKTSGLHAD